MGGKGRAMGEGGKMGIWLCPLFHSRAKKKKIWMGRESSKKTQEDKTILKSRNLTRRKGTCLPRDEELSFLGEK